MNGDSADANERVDELLVQLGDKLSEQRAAAQELGNLANFRATLHLITALRQDESDVVRMWAADALGKIGDPAAVPVLLGALEENSPVASRAADALGIMGKPAVNALIHALRAEVPQVRYWAASALRWAATEVVEPLIGTLRDSDPAIRRNVVQTLGETGDRRAVVPLLERLDDPEWEVRETSITALSRMTEKRLVNSEQVQAIINKAIGQLNSADWRVRCSAIAALQYFHDRSSVLPLLYALDDATSAVRLRAAAALGRIGAIEAVDPLINTLRSPHVTKDLGQTVAVALAQIGSLPLLIQVITDKDAEVRYWVATALGFIGTEEALPYLSALASDVGETRTHAKVRTAATRAIRQIYRRQQAT